jgi:hypothetical protein
MMRHQCGATTFDGLSQNTTRCNLDDGHDDLHDDGCLRWRDPPPPTEAETALIERVAEAIFLAEYTFWCPLEEYEKLMGTKPKVWKTDAPWDTNPDELAEHERDEYRWQAEAAIAVMKAAGQ